MGKKFSTLQKAVVKLAQNMHYTALPKNTDVMAYLKKYSNMLEGCDIYLDLPAYQNVYKQTQQNNGLIKTINKTDKDQTYLFEYSENNKMNYLLVKTDGVWWCPARFKVLKCVFDNKPIYSAKKSVFSPTVFISGTPEQAKHQEKEA